MTSGVRNTPAAILAGALGRHGADLVFGLPGGGPNLDVIEAMSAGGIRFVLAHGETSAAIMAAVYGHLTGRLSAAVVTRGPGAASAVNGAAQATLDRHPLVLITDTVPAASADRIAHQRLDQPNMLGPVVKASITIGSDPGLDELTNLLGHALAAPPGTVHLDYDTSVVHHPHPGLSPDPASEAAQSDQSARSPRSADTAASVDGAETSDGRRIRSLIAGADHPVVIAGLGAIGPADRPTATLDAHLEAFGAPVLTTYQGVGTMPSEHRLAAGLFTNGASERPILERADLIIAIGLDMVEPIPAPWSYGAPVVSLASTPTIYPYLPLAAEVIGDPTRLAARLLTGGHRWAHDAGAPHREAVRAELLAAGGVDDPTVLGPLDVVTGLIAAAPDGLITTVDAGAHFLAVMPLWPVVEPRRLLISNGLATMGFSIPAAIAAGLANPGRPVLCLVGDGGLGMTAAELETIKRLGLPVTVVVFNDSTLSLIRIKQQPGPDDAEVVSYRETDFATVARGFGLEATTVDDRAGLAAALADRWDRPRLIDARIDPAPYRRLLSLTRG